MSISKYCSLNTRKIPESKAVAVGADEICEKGRGHCNRRRVEEPYG